MDLPSFFDAAGFVPRWRSGAWGPLLGWMTIASDVAIFAAFVAMPVSIAMFMRRRAGEIQFPHLFVLFSAFILACGTTHLMDAVIFWWPIYPATGLVKLATAVLSVAAAIAVWRVMPRALALPGLAAMNHRLEHEVQARAAIERDLRARTAELQESEQRLVAAQRAAGVGDWSWDVSGRRMRWSDQMFDLFERDPAQGPPVDPEQHSLLYPPAGERLRQDAMRRIADGQPGASVDLEVRLPSGRRAWFRCVMQGDRDGDGRLRRIWGTVQDVTPEHRQVMALESRHADLLRINEQLEQFAYIASHDLLEPLRKVRFFADVAQAELRPSEGSTASDAMARMLRATDRMHRLVNDLLAFARAGKALVASGAVRVSDAVDEAVDALESQVAAAGASVSTEALPVVSGDRGLLAQVFQNLISNSLRYRHPDRVPAILVRGSIEDRMAVITVSDNGRGFASEDAMRLFQPFVRLHAHAVDGGTGIGLAICRRIVEAHEGTIAAAPLPGGGAAFTVRLPLHEETGHVQPA